MFCTLGSKCKLSIGEMSDEQHWKRPLLIPTIGDGDHIRVVNNLSNSVQVLQRCTQE